MIGLIIGWNHSTYHWNQGEMKSLLLQDLQDLQWSWIHGSLQQPLGDEWWRSPHEGPTRPKRTSQILVSWAQFLQPQVAWKVACGLPARRTLGDELWESIKPSGFASERFKLHISEKLAAGQSWGILEGEDVAEEWMMMWDLGFPFYRPSMAE